MEYVDGGSLRDHLRRLQRLQKYLPLIQCLQIGIQIAEALDYAHNRKIIHRDVKPGNIILKRLSRPDEAGAQPFRALLTDWPGQAAGGQQPDQSGATVGTPTYMSPEQCEGRELDNRSDLYSLGIVLYELIANRLPFTFQTLTEAIAAHRNGLTPPPVSSVRPEVPPIIDALLEWLWPRLPAIALRPARRWPTRYAAPSLPSKACRREVMFIRSLISSIRWPNRRQDSSCRFRPPAIRTALCR